MGNVCRESSTGSDGNRGAELQSPCELKALYTLWCLTVYNSGMSRTNIDIDDELVAEAMRRYNLRSKREAVDLALRTLVGEPLSTQGALELEGSGWDADVDELRGAPPTSL
jgi:Arc/MetJ family transcription regulator